MIAGQEIIDLKTNHIPRDLVPLERLFDNNDVYLKSDGKMEIENTIDCNIGTTIDPSKLEFQIHFLQKLERGIKRLLVNILMFLHGHTVI